MKKLTTLLFAAIIGLPISAQKNQNLPELTVAATRTTANAEGYSVNLRGAGIAKGRPVADVLPFLPNLSRESGTFKINGLAASEIYVDGVKLTDISELDNIPGENIDRIQVRYLAGSDSKAALSGGIIMITLRRPPEGGYYGSITADAEWYRASGFGTQSLGGMINYRYKNLSVYDNLYIGSVRHRDRSEQWFDGPDLHTFLTETTDSRQFSFRNRLSLTQQFRSGAQLGGSYFVAASRHRPSSNSIEGSTVSAIDRRINAINQEGTVKLSLPLNRQGAEFDITADYFNRRSNELTTYSTAGNSVGEIAERSDLDLWKLSSDIVYPRSRRLVWKFGASAQWIASGFTPSASIGSDMITASSTPTATKGFTPIVYASAQGSAWRIRYSAGINWQLNRINYTDRAAAVESRNTQWAINPTIQLMMPFGPRMVHALMLNYKRTLGDIPYSAISSVVTWSDPNNYTVGNPDLKAQSSDMIMAALSLLRNKINLTALYGRTHDRIYWQTFQSTGHSDVFFTKPINVSGQTMWGLGAEWIESPRKWWRFKLSGRVEITPENNVIDNTRYHRTRFKEYVSFNNSFNFGNGWGGMLNTSLEPTYRTLDRTYHAVYAIDGRLYKSMLGNRLQIAAEFTPLGNRRRLDRQAGVNKIVYKYTTPVQYVGLSLTWNFSGGKKVDVDVVDGTQNYHETKDNR